MFKTTQSRRATRVADTGALLKAAPINVLGQYLDQVAAAHGCQIHWDIAAGELVKSDSPIHQLLGEATTVVEEMFATDQLDTAVLAIQTMTASAEPGKNLETCAVLLAKACIARSEAYATAEKRLGELVDSLDKFANSDNTAITRILNSNPN